MTIPSKTAQQHDRNQPTIPKNAVAPGPDQIKLIQTTFYCLHFWCLRYRFRHTHTHGYTHKRTHIRRIKPAYIPTYVLGLEWKEKGCAHRGRGKNDTKRPENLLINHMCFVGGAHSCIFTEITLKYKPLQPWNVFWCYSVETSLRLRPVRESEMKGKGVFRCNSHILHRI